MEFSHLFHGIFTEKNKNSCNRNYDHGATSQTLKSQLHEVCLSDLKKKCMPVQISSFMTLEADLIQSSVAVSCAGYAPEIHLIASSP